MKNNKKNLFPKKVFPCLFCLIIAVLTAISGTIADDNFINLIYFLGYTLFLYFINELNQMSIEEHFQEEIDKLSKRIEFLENERR